MSGGGQAASRGKILVGHTWKATQLATHLATLAPVSYSQDLGVVDFFPSDQVAVLFISEADLITGNSYKRRVVKFRQTTTQRRVVLVQKTGFTADQFSRLQKFVCIELGLPIIPVKTVEEAAKLVVNMAKCEDKFNSNPFRLRRKQREPPDQLVLDSLTQVPLLGQVRARALLERFRSLEGVATAKEAALAEVVGAGVARAVYGFFHRLVE